MSQTPTHSDDASTAPDRIDTPAIELRMSESDAADVMEMFDGMIRPEVFHHTPIAPDDDAEIKVHLDGDASGVIDTLTSEPIRPDCITTAPTPA